MHRVRALDDIIVVCTVYINKCTFTLRCIIAPAKGASVKGRSHAHALRAATRGAASVTGDNYIYRIAQRINAQRTCERAFTVPICYWYRACRIHAACVARRYQ